MDKIRSVLNSSEFILESISKPLLIYNIFVIALICYDATQLDIKSMGKNTFFLIVGSFLIWLLCYLGFEPIVWVLLSLPIFFIVALLALLVLTQIINTDVNYSNNDALNITGAKIKDWFGINDIDTEDKEHGVTHDLSSDFKPPIHPDITCNRPEHLPTISSKDRIAGMLKAVLPEQSVFYSTCNSCD